MSPTVILKGAVKFSMKKLIAGGEMSSSTFTGPGELLFAPPYIGDITSIRLTGQETWNVGKDSFIACTQGVAKDYKNQGFSKAMFSGEGLFVMKITGSGILWLGSFGAIVRKDVSHFGTQSITFHADHKFSCRMGKSISSTMVIWSRGTANMFLNG